MSGLARRHQRVDLASPSMSSIVVPG